MRVLLTTLAILIFACTAFADGPTDMAARDAVTPPPLQYEFYCQAPHVYLWTINASTAFNSELVDDIPDEFYCTNILDVVFYVSQWGGAWVNPSGVYVRFYNSECPPGLVADATYYFAWDQLEKELIYDDPGYFTCYRCRGYLLDPMHIEYDMSIGFQVDSDWGPNPPYCGLVMTDDYVVFGDCQAYWDATYWGYPRWTAVSDYFGVSADVAYCLSDGTGGNPQLTFLHCGADENCENVFYKFEITAGAAPVNDIEICVYDALTGDPVPIEICSHPLGWDCGYNAGPHCVYYETTTDPVPAGETYGPFDFFVATVYSDLMVVWTFTYSGALVAGPDTTYFYCGISDADPTSWGGIKALYR